MADGGGGGRLQPLPAPDRASQLSDRPHQPATAGPDHRSAESEPLAASYVPRPLRHSTSRPVDTGPHHCEITTPQRQQLQRHVQSQPAAALQQQQPAVVQQTQPGMRPEAVVMLQQHRVAAPQLQTKLRMTQQQQEQPRKQLQLATLPHLLEEKQWRELFRQAQEHQVLLLVYVTQGQLCLSFLHW